MSLRDKSISYADFLRSKATVAAQDGVDVDLGEINATLYPHQRQIVQWAVRGGRRAIFAAFGLGKSVMQLETVRLTLEHGPVNGRGLIVCPLGVRQEFERDAQMLGMPPLVRIRTTAEALALPASAIALTNYEPIRDGLLDPSVFTVTSLDEAAILRSFGSKTYQMFLGLFAAVPYRFVATATPSPNRYKELLHYAGYLGIMDTGQSLTRFFKRDSTQANNLTLLESQERNFWLWLASWSCWVQSPAALGFDDGDYRLPPLEVLEHEIPVDHRDRTQIEKHTGQVTILTDAAVSLPVFAAEKRRTLPERVAKAVELVAGDDSQAIVYCHLNDEQRALGRALMDAGVTYSSIDGSLSADEVERRLEEWRDGHTTVLLGKPVMLGVGLNLQQAHRMIFAGIDFKFHDTFQAVHRIHRFGQSQACEVHIVYAESERAIRDALMAKWKQHEELTETMTELIAEHGLSQQAIEDSLTRSLGVERVEVSGDSWTLVNNDCVPEIAGMETDSVGLIVTSIPFANHYEYTPAYEDLGFTEDNDQFWEQMDYLTPELLRVLSPGRIYCCHVKDRINFGNVTGAGIPTSSPFHAEAIFHSRKHGFDYLGMVTVVTDVVRENNQTYRLGWSEQCKDGSKMGVGSPEYVLLFHKPQTDRTRGYADAPVVKDKEGYTRSRWQVDAHAFWRSSGDRNLSADDLAQMGPDKLAKVFTDWSLQDVYDHESHVKIGESLDGRGKLPATFMALAPGSHHPSVWHDVNRMRTLNGEQASRNLTLHVCPLQTDIVERLIRRYSNAGDLVLDPFSGLGTVALHALRMGRRGYGVELNPGYFRDSVAYLEAEARQHAMPTLFDALESDQVAA
jgi:DNA modification methylase